LHGSSWLLTWREEAGFKQALHRRLRRPNIDAVLRKPRIVEVRASVALSRVAQQRLFLTSCDPGWVDG